MPCPAWRGSGLRDCAHRLEEAPPMALEVERLVRAMAPARDVGGQRGGDLGPRGDGALVMRLDVVDLDADVLGRGPGAPRADRAVGALRADPDHAVAELDDGMVDDAVPAHQPRGR